MPCRYAEASDDGTASMLGAGIDSMWLPELPSTVGLFLMLRITGADYEFEEEQTLEVRLVAPDRNETTALEIRFKVDEPAPTKLAGMDTGILLPAVVNWEAEEYGLYTLDVHLDGSRQRSVPIWARDPEDLQQQQQAEN